MGTTIYIVGYSNEIKFVGTVTDTIIRCTILLLHLVSKRLFEMFLNNPSGIVLFYSLNH